jgi:hypothetical protein
LDGRPTSAQSGMDSKMKVLEDASLFSLDDGTKNWDFKHFDRVVGEMEAGSSSVGSILAAMVYQIEK